MMRRINGRCLMRRVVVVDLHRVLAISIDFRQFPSVSGHKLFANRNRRFVHNMDHPNCNSMNCVWKSRFASLLSSMRLSLVMIQNVGFLFILSSRATYLISCSFDAVIVDIFKYGLAQAKGLGVKFSTFFCALSTCIMPVTATMASCILDFCVPAMMPLKASRTFFISMSSPASSVLRFSGIVRRVLLTTCQQKAENTILERCRN